MPLLFCGGLAANLTAAFSVGNGPGGIVVDGSHIWVSNFTDNTVIVTKLQASDGYFSDRVLIPGIAFDGANVWVKNNGGSPVTKVRADMWIVNQGSNNVTEFRASDDSGADYSPGRQARTSFIKTKESNRRLVGLPSSGIVLMHSTRPIQPQANGAEERDAKILAFPEFFDRCRNRAGRDANSRAPARAAKVTGVLTAPAQT